MTGLGGRGSEAGTEELAMGTTMARRFFCSHSLPFLLGLHVQEVQNLLIPLLAPD